MSTGNPCTERPPDPVLYGSRPSGGFVNSAVNPRGSDVFDPVTEASHQHLLEESNDRNDNLSHINFLISDGDHFGNAGHFLRVLLPPANEVWGKVIFSEARVKNSVQGGLPQCMLGYHYPSLGQGRQTPWDHTSTPPGPGRHPPSGSRACWQIWSMSGRYASYWIPILYFSATKNATPHSQIWYKVRLCIYRPQTKFAKVMFSQVFVCPQGVGGLHPGGLGRLPPLSDTMGYGQWASGMHPTAVADPNLQTELNSLNWVKSYSIFNDLAWPHISTHPLATVVGVSPQIKSSNRIELSRLGQDLFEFSYLIWPHHPPTHRWGCLHKS